MNDLLITKRRPGVAVVTATDPFSTLEIHRVDRSVWQEAPTRPGIYLLYGFVDDEPAAYVGMSTTSIRDRIRTHHVTPAKNWFGVLFAVPLGSALHCPAIEAEMIRRIQEAGVVPLVDNRAREERWLDAEDVHVTPAVTSIVAALEMLLGNDIFTPPDPDEVTVVDPIQKTPPLARVYRGPAVSVRPRQESDPAEATHGYVGAGIAAWGRFEGDEPDTRFRVFAGSTWRKPTLDESQVSYKHQARVAKMQAELLDHGALDEPTMTFHVDHVFDNWSQAVIVVSGKGQYSGGYHWQRLEDP
ncbi:MAG: GIY-YIG nuclease family protein [Gaiellaceae bacterium]